MGTSEERGDRLPGSIYQLTLLAWLTMVGFDLFLHGGVLAGIYVRGDAFLLAPEDAFRRIPFGYAAFLVLAFLLVWLIRRLEIRRGKDAFLFGLGLGGAIWLSLTLGLYSITSAATDLLLGWALGQTLELGLAGLIVGLRIQKYTFRRMLVLVLLGVLALVILTVVLQNTGLAPAVHRG